MERLTQMNGHFQPEHSAMKMKPTLDVWESMKLDSYLRPHTIEKRKALRKFMEDNLSDLNEHYTRAEFPFHIKPKVQSLGINGLDIEKKYGGHEYKIVESGAFCLELAKKDLSLATFFCVHNAIGQKVVHMLGNEEQKARILPQTVNMDKICAFGLTEPNYGSDASSLQTTAKKVDGGWVLNGEKRWIGNASIADFIMVFAKNLDDGGKVQCFVLTKGTKGFTYDIIQNKFALRIVQNSHFKMENCFVPDNMKLEKATSFSAANDVLEFSRFLVAWMGAGVAVGAYEAALKYCLTIKQFGKPIAEFQLI